MAPSIFYVALFPLALAQTTVLTALYTGFETQTMGASLISADSTKTTLSIGCPGEISDCGAFPHQTMVFEGSTSYSADASDPNTDFTFTQECVLGPKSVVCEESAGGSEANFPGRSTTTYDASEMGAIVFTITGGDISQLSAQTTGSGSASAATPTGAAQTGSKSESMASVTKNQGTASASASASASMSASGSAAAAPTATGAAAARIVALGGGLIGAVVGLLGGQLL
jgi:hypothetical protein